MPVRKDDAGHHRRERDVGRAGNRPAATQLRGADGGGEGGVDEGRRDHAAHCRGERRHRLTRGCERSAWQCRLEDLFRRQREEEHHADVIHPEVQRMRHPVIADEIKIGPHHGRDGPGKKQQRIVKNEASEIGTRMGHQSSVLSPRAGRTRSGVDALTHSEQYNIPPARRKTWARSPTR